MLDKYITIKEKTIVAGQSAAGTWYIKELPAENTKELEKLIGECNRICNKYNKKEKTPPATPKKEKKTKTG